MSVPGNTPATGARSTAPFSFGVTITVLRSTGQRTWDGQREQEASHTISGCSLSQRGTTEDVSGNRRDTVTTGLRVHAPPGADVLAADVVTLSPPVTGRWQVVGDVHAMTSPFTGWAAGCVFEIERVTG